TSHQHHKVPEHDSGGDPDREFHRPHPTQTDARAQHDDRGHRSEEGLVMTEDFEGEKPRQTRGDTALNREDRLELNAPSRGPDGLAHPMSSAATAGDHVPSLRSAHRRGSGHTPDSRPAR